LLAPFAPRIETTSHHANNC